MQWNSGYSESVYTFANTIHTIEGGTHEEGFRAALTTLVNKFAREWGVLKEKDANLSGEDIREGLTAIVSIKLGEPQFEGQTKAKLGNTEAKTFVQKLVNEQLGAWFEAEPGRGQGHRAQVDAGRGRAHRRAQGARPRPQPQGPHGRRRPARQAHRLLVDQPRRVRGLHRRGRLRRRLGAQRPRPAHPGDPARSAARSSTSRRRASTRCCRTTRCRR